MTPEREGKRVLRALRTIPVDAIAPHIAADEASSDGLWCIVGGELSFVLADGGRTETFWDDPLVPAQFVRWIQAHPERVHGTHEVAVAAVRSLLAVRSDA